jgi:predicted NAD/FAD-dependent oxidoreductase
VLSALVKRSTSKDIPMACDASSAIAVIGAGISGLTCARTLADSGSHVTVFEKSRGMGGRMATRRAESGLQFDHGAQFFTVRDPRFQRLLNSWQADGIVQPWKGRIVSLRNGTVEYEKTPTNRFVATPDMNAVCKQLARDLDVRTNTWVAPPSRQSENWLVLDDERQELGHFDIVIVSAPAPQAAELLQDAPDLEARALSVKVDGCWAVLAEFPARLPIDFDGAFVQNSPLSWIARNSSKPGRDARLETWVLHASADWTQTHLEEEAEVVRVRLLSAFEQATGLGSVTPKYSTSHRWRFALPVNPLPERCLFDSQLGIGACGDWCAGPRVEGAMISGLALAKKVLDWQTNAPRQQDIEQIP